ncbi:hypothetical protein VdG2_04721 [Verticillium dahliae VDG2]|nr:hypothetical protein VdG2_04721 [Verticillium dahliae VDG2]
MDTVTPRRRLIGLSTKMYFSPSRTKEYLDALLPRLATCPGPHAIDIFLIPDFLSLPAAVTQTGTAPLLLGAQDCYAEDAGAYTGEVSPASLAELGVRIGREGPVRILYGGSAGPGTFARLKGGVDGLFLGRFGHDVDRFWRTVEEVASA